MVWALISLYVVTIIESCGEESLKWQWLWAVAVIMIVEITQFLETRVGGHQIPAQMLLQALRVVGKVLLGRVRLKAAGITTIIMKVFSQLSEISSTQLEQILRLITSSHPGLGRQFQYNLHEP